MNPYEQVFIKIVSGFAITWVVVWVFVAAGIMLLG
jgi:hypothetical protein